MGRPAAPACKFTLSSSVGALAVSRRPAVRNPASGAIECPNSVGEQPFRFDDHDRHIGAEYAAGRMALTDQPQPNEALSVSSIFNVIEDAPGRHANRTFVALCFF